MPRNILFVPETGSTNADLSAQIARGEILGEGHWLVADRQNDGRGRLGRQWLDAPGNFMGSTLVRVQPHDPPVSMLSFVAAISVYETLITRLENPSRLQLKWPNDLLLDGAKLAGILLERSGDFVVIGIGVNLCAAPVLAGRATRAISDVTSPPERDAFAQDLAAQMEIEIQRWRENGFAPLRNRWLAAAHSMGTRLSVTAADGTRMTGTFDGLEDDGALRLCLADGSRPVIRAGDVDLEGAHAARS